MKERKKNDNNVGYDTDNKTKQKKNDDKECIMINTQIYFKILHLLHLARVQT